VPAFRNAGQLVQFGAITVTDFKTAAFDRSATTLRENCRFR
jgi:hypothetical protein